MKWLVVAGILVMTASVCQAEEGDGWKRIGGSESSNTKVEVQTASIESINPTTVRALMRLVPAKPGNDWSYNKAVVSVEYTVDMDCKKPRHKVLQQVRITEDGYRTTIDQDSVPTFQPTSPMSLVDMVRTVSCKSEGKLK